MAKTAVSWISYIKEVKEILAVSTQLMISVFTERALWEWRRRAVVPLFVWS
jgi:hypothetical protein